MKVVIRRKTYKKLDWGLYILVLPAIVYIVIFKYIPMYGVQIAFRDFSPVLGIAKSPWVGFEHFAEFFGSFNFKRILVNTVLLSVYELLWAFPFPVVIALLLNQLKSKRFKLVLQNLVYMPHFISTVVLVGMMVVIFNPGSGVINQIINLLGGESVNFLTAPKYFRTLYIGSGIWKNSGWSAIIYLAALSAIDPRLYEAAAIDGAGKLRRIVNIDIPSILPTIMIMLILSVGRIMSIGFEKSYLMQNSLNISVSEIIATYVYKIGLQQAKYDYAAAIGFFNNIINMVLLIATNRISKKITGNSLW